MFSGSFVALATPFRNDRIDEFALSEMVRFHLGNGTDGLVPMGTTGESPTLDAEEHRLVVSLVVSEVAGRIPVIAGAGSNNTREAIALTQHAQRCGADATLHVTGYYNRPSQAGHIAHFNAVHEATDSAIILYNIPSRAVVGIDLDTMVELARLERVVGVKDATADLARPARERLRIGTDFCLLSGEDATAVAYNAAGGNGCISVTANVAPALCAQMQGACARGDYVGAMSIQQRLLPLHDALFLEPSPGGVKYACSLLGLCEEQCRLPMTTPTQTARQAIRAAMTDLKLI
ncbi:MAG: 4-hydroxy-tetrahydrodipicolinate synthase [Gammaproteobacteria bacterium]|jgi:4-hydroxy-tetrahydrodipicolinate synthase